MTQRHLDGKVAIVTGASRVAVNYVSGSAGAEAVVAGIAARGGDAIAIRADVSMAGEAHDLVATTLDHFGRVDILVNNAGIMVARGFLETSEDDWDRTIDINLKGPYLLSKEVAPIMIRQEAGTIINMSSNSGLYHPSAMRFTEYVVSKAGLNGLTKALALALGPHITVNAICPGWIRTDMLEEVDPEVHQRILAETALARWGTPEDIAASAVFLASSEAAFITGELLIVAGGRGMH
jgi:3-oxoacyl-[acyl-carrier protein] reductase